VKKYDTEWLMSTLDTPLKKGGSERKGAEHKST
jgi:hypothetical protein